eukprot:361981-Chlamydomonas_euryale.AAC.3
MFSSRTRRACVGCRGPIHGAACNQHLASTSSRAGHLRQKQRCGRSYGFHGNDLSPPPPHPARDTEPDDQAVHLEVRHCVPILYAENEKVWATASVQQRLRHVVGRGDLFVRAVRTHDR